MRLSDLLEIHYRHAGHGGHPKVVGDGFLMRENFVYRNIRNAALSDGCKLVKAWPEYVAGALFQLDKIVAEKRIPLMLNLALLEKIEAKRRNTFDVDEIPELPRSYALHESAHLVADRILKKVAAGTRNKRLLKTVMGESFANTVEVMGSSVSLTAAQIAFFQMNSYRSRDTVLRRAALKVIEVLGFQMTFQLVFYSYLYSNFLYSQVSMGAVKDIVSGFRLGFRLSPRQYKACFDLFSDGVRLSPVFRTQTTGYYLLSQGFDGDVHDLLKFNFRNIIRSNKAWSKAIAEMARVAEHGPVEV